MYFNFIQFKNCFIINSYVVLNKYTLMYQLINCVNYFFFTSTTVTNFLKPFKLHVISSLGYSFVLGGGWGVNDEDHPFLCPLFLKHWWTLSFEINISYSMHFRKHVSVVSKIIENLTNYANSGTETCTCTCNTQQLLHVCWVT